MVPRGVFKVDRLARVNRGLISVSGSSFESYIVDNLYLGDQNDISAYPQGSNVVNSIRDVILTSFDNAVFEVLPGVDTKKTLSGDLVMPVGKTYWDAVESLADLIESDVYCTPAGVFRHRSPPKVRGHAACSET